MHHRFGLMLTCAIAASLVTDIAGDIYSEMGDAEFDPLAAACLDPMVATFKKEIEQRSDSCPHIRLRCDSLYWRSVRVECVKTPADNSPVLSELADKDSVLHACSGTMSNAPVTEYALAEEMLDRLCDGPGRTSQGSSYQTANEFLGDLKTKLQSSLKTPADALAIGKFVVDLINTIKSEGQCTTVGVHCMEKEKFQHWPNPVIIFDRCSQQANMANSKLAVTGSNKDGYQLQLFGGVARRFRASASANAELRTSRIVYAMRKIACPMIGFFLGKTQTRTFNEKEFTKNAASVKF